MSSKIEKKCVICGEVFHVFPCRAKSASTCSRLCMGKLLRRRQDAVRMKRECVMCGDVFSFPPSKATTACCCSVRCANKLQTLRIMPSGKDSPNWRGGVTKHARGYLYRSTQGHPYASHPSLYVFEHRIVMEEHMRKLVPNHSFLVDHGGIKYLSPEIDVHHLNENKTDNRFSNLLACTPAAHRMIHNGQLPMAGQSWPEYDGRPEYESTVVECSCLTCGAKFNMKRSTIKRGGGKYCSRQCFFDRNK